jgi:hypothetical protein
VRAFEVDVGAMRSFAAYGAQPWPDLRVDLTSRPGTGSAYRVEGTIANQGSTDIGDCVLVWNDEPIQIADLPAGQSQHIDVGFASSATNYRLIDALLTSTPAGIGANRERQRRREILQSLFATPTYPGGPSLPGGGQLSNLTLIGWLSESPLSVQVESAQTEVDATTLLIASLPAPAADPGTTFLPKRSLTWRYSGTGAQQSPYSLYNGQDEVEFTFQLPGTAYQVEELFLHLDALNGSPYGTPPPVEVQEPSSGTWTALAGLDWGRNPLPDPQRYVAADGTIVLRLSRRAITNPLAIDLSAIVTNP